MKRAGLASWCVWALAGCAATPMQPSVWDEAIAMQAARIGLESRCCTEYAQLPALSLQTGPVDLAFDANAAIVRFNGAAMPAVRVALPTSEDNRQLQFFSFSDRKRGALRLGALLFLRPTLVFFDAHGTQLSVLPDLALCWGESQGSGGVWARATIPSNAAFVVVGAGIAQPTQLIDTRRGGLDSLGVAGGAAANAIADARQSYINEIRVGYEGLASLEVVGADRPPLGRCVSMP